MCDFLFAILDAVLGVIAAISGSLADQIGDAGETLLNDLLGCKN